MQVDPCILRFIDNILCMDERGKQAIIEMLEQASRKKMLKLFRNELYLKMQLKVAQLLVPTVAIE